MSSMQDTVSVHVDVDIGANVDAIRAQIIKRAAVHMLQQVSPYGDGDECFTSLGRDMRGEITKAISAEVQKIVGPAVAAALDEGVQRTDTYGSPVGPKLTLREVIVDEAQKVLAKKIEVRDNYARSESVIEQVVRSEVQRTLVDELKAEIKAESERVKKVVREQAAAIVTESVQRAARL